FPAHHAGPAETAPRPAAPHPGLHFRQLPAPAPGSSEGYMLDGAMNDPSVTFLDGLTGGAECAAPSVSHPTGSGVSRKRGAPPFKAPPHSRGRWAMSYSTPKTTAELLSLVDQAWAALEGAVARLEPVQLTDRRDAAGWAVKDHLIHVAAWEDFLLARLTGQPTHEALGLHKDALAQDEDTQNAAILALPRPPPLAHRPGTPRATHRATRARLAALDDGAVAGSVADIVPPSPERDERPAADWIAGNTWEHYNAHLSWIRDLVDRG